MTPERLAEIRRLAQNAYDGDAPGVFGDALLELLAEVERLRKADAIRFSVALDRCSEIASAVLHRLETAEQPDRQTISEIFDIIEVRDAAYRTEPR